MSQLSPRPPCAGHGKLKANTVLKHAIAAAKKAERKQIRSKSYHKCHTPVPVILEALPKGSPKTIRRKEQRKRQQSKRRDAVKVGSVFEHSIARQLQRAEEFQQSIDLLALNFKS